MSTPTVPFYPMTHDDAQELIAAIRQGNTPYIYQDARSIVSAIRDGKDVPNGIVFKENHAVYGDIYFVTRARNQHKVAGDTTRPTVTIQPLYLLSANGGSSATLFQFDRQEAFKSVSETIPAGTVCKFTTIAYGNWAAGTYNFTASAAIPAGSKLCINGYQNTALTALSVTVYADAKATSPSAQYAISSGAGSATLDLGTWGTDCNHPQCVSYGSNNDEQSNMFQFLNGDSGSEYMSSIFAPKTEWDMMDTTFASKKGFLGGFSDEFRSYLGLCAIPNITNSVYETAGYTLSSAYTYNGYFFLPSRKEIYGSNEIAAENDETQFGYYKDIATSDADKLMHAKGATAATTYWLRTPYAGDAVSVRIWHAGSGGALDSRGACDRNAAAPLAILA